MKIFLILALFTCVALAEYDFYEEAVTSEQAYNAYKYEGISCTTFGLSWCKAAFYSKFAIRDALAKLENPPKYTYINCNKCTEGVCRGLFDNYLDYADPEHKFMPYHLPRTFCMKRDGDYIKVLPIHHSGRLHERQRKDDTYIAEFIERVRAL